MSKNGKEPKDSGTNSGELVPQSHGGALKRGAPLCFEHHGNLALRDGRWKIVSMFRRNKPTRWQLYDMRADRTELRDLAADQQGVIGQPKSARIERN